MKKINYKIFLPIIGVLLLCFIGVVFFGNHFKKQVVKSMDYYMMDIFYYNGEKDIDITASYSKDSNAVMFINNIEMDTNPYEKNMIYVNPYELLKSNLSNKELFKDKVSKKLTMASIWHSNVEMLKILSDSSQELSCEFENFDGSIGHVLCKNDKEELEIEIY